MKNLILIILALMLCYGCKKDKPQETPVFLGTYHSALTMQEGPVLMYTKNKITTDINIIKSYLQRNKITYTNYYFNQETLPVKAGFVNITAKENYVDFVMDFNAILHTSVVFPIDTLKSRIVESTSTYLLTRAIKPDTINDYIPVGSPVFGPPPGLDSAYSIYKFKNPQKFIAICSCTGYTGGQYIIWRVHPIVIEHNRYYIPVISYSVYRSSENGSEQYNYNDELTVLNPNLANVMGPKDTTVVQQGLVELIKQ